MTTRHDMFLRVRTAMGNVDLGVGIDLEAEVRNELAWAAIEAVINTIGDHALGKMIGDAGTPRRETEIVSKVQEVGKGGGVEVLQDDDDSDTA